MKWRILFGFVVFFALVIAAPGGDQLAKRVQQVSPSVVTLIIRLNLAADQNSKDFPEFVKSCFQNGVCIAGTGFFVNTHGDIVTAAHVVESMTEVASQLKA